MRPWQRLTNLIVDRLIQARDIVLDRRSGYGIKADWNDPQFTWRDLEGRILYRDVGVGSPALATFRDNVRGLNFAAGDDYDLVYHVPHDFVPGSDMYIHLHWCHNGTNIADSFVIDYHCTYAKGHGQAIYPAEKNITQTLAGLTLAARPQYGHELDEVQLSTAGGSATLLNTDDIEPDGLIKIHFDVTAIPTITGGSGKPFIDHVDVHYLSTNIGTKQKSPDFYAA